MALILVPDTWNRWLKGDPEAAAALMKPANEGALVGQLMPKAVGNVKEQRPELSDEVQ